jgi:hypothetical protein
MAEVTVDCNAPQGNRYGEESRQKEAKSLQCGVKRDQSSHQRRDDRHEEQRRQHWGEPVDEPLVFVHPAARDALSGSESQNVQVSRHFSTHNDPNSCPYPHW